jgi:hypothetical protein
LALIAGDVPLLAARLSERLLPFATALSQVVITAAGSACLQDAGRGPAKKKPARGRF